jgi:alkanesulfonate monooxygenase SsuD/methylene tetrahydromethanopterin reductase-like flavin-dependent oxidoreductase (luciferase family)
MFGATTPAELVALGEHAEALGIFDSVWVGDSLLAKPRLDSIVLLAAVAARTSKVKLGPACLASFPLRHPISLAYQWASLDVLSSGRTIMVACIGGGTKSGAGEFDVEYAAFQADPRERAARMEEGIEILRNLWTQDPASHEGRFFRYDGVRMGPKPVQQPSPPIWVTANPHSVGITSSAVRERLFRRVARLGDGWMTAGVTPDEFAEDLGEIHRCLREAGKDPRRFPSSIHYMINIDENRGASLDEHQAFLREYYSFEWPRDTLDRVTAFGAPEECAEKLQAYFDRGLTTICLRFTSWDQRGQVDRFAQRVAPLLR